MKELYVCFVRPECGEEFLVVLPSFWRMLWWLIRHYWQRDHIVIFAVSTEVYA